MKSLGYITDMSKYHNVGIWSIMEYGLEYITFYVQKHVAHVAICFNPPLVRENSLGATAFVRLTHWVICLEI